MKVEIWSDVMCPFCYIGKRRFEKALSQFEDRDNLEIIWKSFQLSPDIKTDPTINSHEFLAKHKGMSVDQARQLNQQVVQMAATEGLEYNLDKQIVANSFNAHRFTHFAKAHGRQHDAEEALFRAHFTEGKNIDDYAILVDLGVSVGLDGEALRKSLERNDYADDVRQDIYESQQVGLRGVPHFLINGKYTISGAQAPELFLTNLRIAYEEWKVASAAE